MKPQMIFADDEDRSRKAIIDVLHFLGYNIGGANCGREFRDKASGILNAGGRSRSLLIIRCQKTLAKLNGNGLDSNTLSPCVRLFQPEGFLPVFFSSAVGAWTICRPNFGGKLRYLVWTYPTLGSQSIFRSSFSKGISSVYSRQVSCVVVTR